MFTKISHPMVNDVNVYLREGGEEGRWGGRREGGEGGGGRGWGGGGRGERGGRGEEGGGRGSLTERKHFTHTFFVWKIKW